MIVLGHLKKFRVLTDLEMPKSTEEYHKYENNRTLK